MHQSILLCILFVLVGQPVIQAADSSSDDAAVNTTASRAMTPLAWRNLVYVRDSAYRDHNYVLGATEGSGAIVETNPATGEVKWILLDGILKLGVVGETMRATSAKPGTVITSTPLRFSKPDCIDPVILNNYLIKLHSAEATSSEARHAPFLTGPTWNTRCNNNKGARLIDAQRHIERLGLQYKLLYESIEDPNAIVTYQYPEPGKTLGAQQSVIFLRTAARVRQKGLDLDLALPTCSPQLDTTQQLTAGAVPIPSAVCPGSHQEYTYQLTTPVRFKCGSQYETTCLELDSNQIGIDWTWAIPTCLVGYSIVAECQVPGGYYHSLVVRTDAKELQCAFGLNPSVTFSPTKDQILFLTVDIPFDLDSPKDAEEIGNIVLTITQK
jgi:hypothetical protein